MESGNASMGPLPFGSGRGALMGKLPLRADASMGPLPFGSGRVDSCRRSRTGTPASMGPLPFGSGRCPSDGPRPHAVSRLQWGRSLSEAEGARSASLERARAWRFNGAAPFRKRKGRQAREVPHSPPRAASMGPLPFGSGRWPCRSPGSSRRCKLQWGRSLSEAEGRVRDRGAEDRIRCFNGAAPFRKRKGRGTPDRGCEPRSRFNGAAPFRKRKEGREDALAVRRFDRASMGPLPFGSGRIGEIEFRNMAPGLLQWGRSLSEAEGSADVEQSVAVRSASMGPLPFGSGRGPAIELPSHLSERFNGAAPFRKRKEPFRTEAALAAHAASMGPLPFGSGRASGRHRDLRHVARASMGPLPFGSGRSRSRIVCGRSV